LRVTSRGLGDVYKRQGHYNPSELSQRAADGGSIGAYVKAWTDLYRSLG
jgi:hypothetical protein